MIFRSCLASFAPVQHVVTNTTNGENLSVRSRFLLHFDTLQSGLHVRIILSKSEPRFKMEQTKQDNLIEKTFHILSFAVLQQQHLDEDWCRCFEPQQIHTVSQGTNFYFLLHLKLWWLQSLSHFLDNDIVWFLFFHKEQHEFFKAKVDTVRSKRLKP